MKSYQQLLLKTYPTLPNRHFMDKVINNTFITFSCYQQPPQAISRFINSLLSTTEGKQAIVPL